MAIEQIDLEIGIEQSFTLEMNDIVYRIDLRYDDFNDRWFMDIYNNDTDVLALGGQNLWIGTNALKDLEYLNLGTGLGLFDTDPSNTDAIVKADLGNRVKMYREVAD
jgi:hypothetical protein